MCVRMELRYGFNRNSTRDQLRDETFREVVKWNQRLCTVWSQTVGRIEPSGFPSIGNVTTMKLLLMIVTGRNDLLFHVSNKITKNIILLKLQEHQPSKSTVSFLGNVLNDRRRYLNFGKLTRSRLPLQREACGLLGCDTVQFSGRIPTLRRHMLPPSSRLKCVGSGIDFLYEQVTRNVVFRTKESL